MLDVYVEPEADADANPLEPTALKVAADRTPLRKLAANVVDSYQAPEEGAKKAEKKPKRKHRVSFGGEKVRHFQKSPREKSMNFFRRSLSNVPAKATFDDDPSDFFEDADNNMTMDMTDMSLVNLDMVDTLSGMNTFAGAAFDEEDLMDQSKPAEDAEHTMRNFAADANVTQGLKALVGDLNEGLFDTTPAPGPIEEISAPAEAPVQSEAALAREEPQEDDEDSAMEMTVCAPRTEEMTIDGTPAEEPAEAAPTPERCSLVAPEESLDDDDAMAPLDDEFQFDDDFGDEDATEHMFAVTHGRASLGPLELAAQTAAMEAPESTEAATQGHPYRQSMGLTVGDLETGTLTYNHTCFSDGSSMSSASITDLYSTSNPRINEQSLAKQPRESMAADDRTEHIFGARGPRMRPSLARRKSSMGFGDDEDTNNVFGSGVNTQVLFDQVEGIRHKAAAVQAEFEEGEEDEEDNSIFMKTTGPSTATSELARMVAESREQMGKENLQPMLDDDDTQMDDFDDEDKTEKLLLSQCPTFAGGDNTGTFSTFSLLNSASRHSTQTLSELASKLQLTPLDVRPHPQTTRGNSTMSLEYFLCQAKVHFVGISTMRKNSTCPVSIPYEELLVEELPEGEERSIVPHAHTKLVVEPQLETYKSHNSGYEEQILAKQQSIEQLASELSRNNPRSFVLAMQPESRDIVVNCLKELKQKCRMDAKAQWYSQHIHGLTVKRDRLRETLKQVQDEVKAWEEAVEDALSSDMKSSCPSTPQLRAKYTSDSAKKVQELQDTVEELEDSFDTLQGLQGWRLSGIKQNSVELVIAGDYRLSFEVQDDKMAGQLQALPGTSQSNIHKALFEAANIQAYLDGITSIKQLPTAAQTVSLWLGRMTEVLEECEEAEQLHPNLSLSYGCEEGNLLVKGRFVPASGPAGAALHSFTVTLCVSPTEYPFSPSLPLSIDNEEGGSTLTMARNGIACAALRELSAKFAPPRCSFGRLRHTFAALAEALYGQ